MQSTSLNEPLAQTATRRGRMPAGLLGMLALVLATELGLAHSSARLCGPVMATYVFTRNAIDSGRANVDLLIIGDSVLKMGLQPKVLTDRLGKTSFNLAQSGGQPIDTYFALRQALRQGARPKAILFDYVPNLVFGTPFVWATETVPLRTWFDCLELASVGRNFSYTAQQLAAKLLPSYRYRYEIGGELMALWKRRARENADVPRRFWRNWSVNQGAELQTPSPWVLQIAEAQDERNWRLPSFYVHPVNSRYIRRTFELALSHGIDIYWLIPPINPNVQAKRVRRGVDAGFSRYVHAFQRLFPTLKVIDGRNAHYDPLLFVDAVHLDYRGAHVYSEAVADVLERGIGRSRWAEIARYEKLDPLPPLEDMETSRLVIAAGAGAAKK